MNHCSPLLNMHHSIRLKVWSLNEKFKKGFYNERLGSFHPWFSSYQEGDKWTKPKNTATRISYSDAPNNLGPSVVIRLFKDIRVMENPN